MSVPILNPWVILLRGINVGKAKRLAMAELRQALESWGFSEVRTLLNSGNAVARPPQTLPLSDAEAWLENRLAQRFGFDIPVLIRTAEAWKLALAEQGLTPESPNPERWLFIWARSSGDLSSLERLRSLAGPEESFQVGFHGACLKVPGTLGDSAVAEQLLGHAGRNFTTRNGATTLKISALLV